MPISNQALAALAALALTTPALAQSLEFTYQGVLEAKGDPFTGDANFVVELFTGTTKIDEFEVDEVPVDEGVFTLKLAFDQANFNGQPLAVRFNVEAPANQGEFEPLTPDQPIHYTPYAQHARTAENALFAASAASADVASIATFASNAGSLDVPAILSANADTQPVLRVVDTTPNAGFGAVEIISGLSPNLPIERTVLTAKSGDTPIGIAGLGDRFGIVATVNDASAADAFGLFAQATAFNAALASSQTALRAFHQSTGIFADLATATHAADLSGDARISGEFFRTFSTTATQEDLLHPVAYGFIDFNGAVVNGTPNFTAVYNPSLEWYEISIDDESYFFNEYVTVVTASGSDIIARTSSSSGRLLIILTDADFNRRTASFGFVTYRTAGGEGRAAPRPALEPLPAGAAPDN